MSTTSLKGRRTRLGYTQQQVAEMLGVSQQTIARWEGGGDIPTKYLKDLAVILVCRVSDLVGESADGRGGLRTLRVANRMGEVGEDEDDEQLPYGTARVVFIARLGQKQDASSLVHNYPITESEMKRLYSRLQDEDERATWFSFETLDNWLVLVNRSELESFEMIGDDVTAMPPFEHEEVYAAVSDHEMRRILESGDMPGEDDDTAPYSKAFIEGVAKVVEEWGGMDAILDRVSGVNVETISGRRENLFSDPGKDVYERISSFEFALDLGWDKDNAPVGEQTLELGTEGYYRSSFYRLGALRLIEVPLYPYKQAVSAMWAEAEGDEASADD
jgi:transcriptional regulator with XRE-family HTH domain